MARLFKYRSMWLFAAGVGSVFVSAIGLALILAFVWWPISARANARESVAHADEVLSRFKSDKVLSEAAPKHDVSLDEEYANLLLAWGSCRSRISVKLDRIADGGIESTWLPPVLDWSEMDALFDSVAGFAYKLRGNTTGISLGMQRTLTGEDFLQLERERELLACVALRAQLLESHSPDVARTYLLAALRVSQRRLLGETWREGREVAAIRAAIVQCALRSSVVVGVNGAELARLCLETNVPSRPSSLARLEGELESRRNWVERAAKEGNAAGTVDKSASELQNFCAALDEWHTALPGFQDPLHSIGLLISLMHKHKDRGSVFSLWSEAYSYASEQLCWRALEAVAKGSSALDEVAETTFGPGWGGRIRLGEQWCAIALTGSEVISWAKGYHDPVEWTFSRR